MKIRFTEISGGVIVDFIMMKQQVRDAYPSYEWKTKVDYMSRSQIYAIHSSLKKRGELPEPKKKYETFWFNEKELLNSE